MQLCIASIVTAFVAIAGLTACSPLAVAPNLPARYNLQTRVVHSEQASGSDKNNLFVTPYHTGAGMSASILASSAPTEWYAYYQGDQQYFSYNRSARPWSLLVEHHLYQAWMPTVITSLVSESPLYQGFTFNEHGLQFNNTNGGWLACDWWYAKPQLFLLNQNEAAKAYPSVCSKVELHPVAI